jgi:hypothetical protein
MHLVDWRQNLERMLQEHIKVYKVVVGSCLLMFVVMLCYVLPFILNLLMTSKTLTTRGNLTAVRYTYAS